MENHISKLKEYFNFSMSEIMALEVRQGARQIARHEQENYDRYMIDKIHFFSAHGIDINKLIDDDGRNRYKEFLDSKREERREQELKLYDIEKIRKKKIPVFDKDMQKFMMEQDLKRNG